MAANQRIVIVGQGLAGTCLAWRLWDRGRAIEVVDRGGLRGSSVVAAGLVSPVTGKGMNPSWRVAEFLPLAMGLYRSVEMVLGEEFFHRVPVLRLFRDGGERAKFEAKRAQLERWIEEVVEGPIAGVNAEWGGVVWKGGGWLDTQRFLEASKGYFREHGLYSEREVDADHEAANDHITVLCQGAAGLGSGPFAYLPERRAKGEILTVRILGMTEGRVLSRGGWLVPVGGGLYRAGATYAWDDLEAKPTRQAREELEGVVRTFTDAPYEVIEQLVGVRPIIRRSQPVIGPHPDRENLYVFNGLGSKGVLYAPGVAERLANHLCQGVDIEDDLSVERLGADARNPAGA
ncbi:MAG: FAD-binding oxidoreductase [Akkermansiaceae bacterium]|nr:FAD-binding oxidoreductase [Akkermansiaceae bacterium]NNM30994.1 FAD-binding oxidoreductase [Akkermansiaceae bacterium]